MPTEQDIKNLCTGLLASKSDQEFEFALGTLKTALREHTAQVENRAIKMFLENLRKPSSDK